MPTLDEIHIQNFRSCKDSFFTFSAFTPLVGYNNGGKSNILFAIGWLLNHSSLTESDFNDPNKEVQISGTITGITQAVLDKLEQKHKNQIEPYCRDEKLQFRIRQPKPGVPKKEIKWEVRDPLVDEDNLDDAWKSGPTGITAAVKAIFPESIEIGAMEDVVEDVGKSKSTTTIGKLIAAIARPITERYGPNFKDMLDNITKKFGAESDSRAEELNTLDEAVNDKLKDLFPDIRVRVDIPTPQLPELFRSGTIKVDEYNEGEWRSISSTGNGAQRSIQMALVRQLAEGKSHKDNLQSTILLLVDEPELYLHPQGVEQVRIALKALSEKGYQVVFATHSPLMIGREDVANTIIVRKTPDKGTFAQKRLADAINDVLRGAPAQTRMLCELTNLIQILFCERILVTEGKTETILLPEVYEKLKGRTLHSDKIALVGARGAGNICNFLKILKVMELDAKALVDLDFAFRDGVKCDILRDDDVDLESSKKIFTKLSNTHGFKLGNDGFPEGEGDLTSSQAFVVFAKDPEGDKVVSRLHEKLKTENIWLWKLGAIEEHLGLEGKGEKCITEYQAKLRESKPEDAIEDLSGVEDFLEWLNPNSTIP